MKKVLIGLGSVLAVWLIFACATIPTMAQSEDKEKADVEELVEFLKEFDPSRLEQLKRLEEQNPERFEKVLKKSYEQMLKLKKLKQEDPEQFEKMMQKGQDRRKQMMRERRQKMEGERPSREGLEGRERGRRGRQGEGRPSRGEDSRRPGERQREIKPKEVLGFLKKFNPAQAEELRRLQKENPEEFREVLRQVYHEMRGLKELKQHDPERFEAIARLNQLEYKSHKLAEKYRQSDNEKDKEQIEAKLRKILSEVFDSREQERMRDIERLEKELSRLKEKMARRKEMREQIIDERLKRLAGEKEEWEW